MKRKPESSIIFSWHENDSYQWKTKEKSHATQPISTSNVENGNCEHKTKKESRIEQQMKTVY